jgi:hypothetical protein
MSSTSPSSLALPVKANADICRERILVLHLGHLGFLRVFTVFEKKLKMVLQRSQ